MRNIMLSCVLLLCCFSAVSHAQSAPEKAVRNTLALQSAAWNRGDIEAFMKGYWENDSLMFIGKSGVTYGWTNTLNNYKKGYPDAAAMGKLTFTILKVKSLSAEYQQVVGKWHLDREQGNVEGHFTLLFQKIKGQWVIVMDHSS
ncbi:MAG: nuclear transport factor 2 family protein [Sphingobacteriales bacterium]|nr:MAG: nuclear transport factor 2 family protein [Sphingobacteriales bacterium]